jgi:hypothetical protein
MSARLTEISRASFSFTDRTSLIIAPTSQATTTTIASVTASAGGGAGSASGGAPLAGALLAIRAAPGCSRASRSSLRRRSAWFCS